MSCDTYAHAQNVYSAISFHHWILSQNKVSNPILYWAFNLVTFDSALYSWITLNRNIILGHENHSLSGFQSISWCSFAKANIHIFVFSSARLGSARLGSALVNMKFANFATSAKVAMAEFAQKQANSAITTFALGAKFCKVYICNIFAQGIFYANM